MRFAKIFRTVKFFSPKEQPSSFEEVPNEFEEANVLYKEDKKLNLSSISTLLSPHLKVAIDIEKCMLAKEMFAESGVVEAESIAITDIKYVKKLPIPTVSIEAVFRLNVTEAYIAANKEDEIWQVRHGGEIAEAVCVAWDIDYWGVENLDLSLGDYKESGIFIENE